MNRLVLALLIFIFSASSYSASSWRLFERVRGGLPSNGQQTCLAALAIHYSSQYARADFIRIDHCDMSDASTFKVDAWFYEFSYAGDGSDNCQEGQVPKYPSLTCPEDKPEEPAPEPHQCPEAGTFYKSLMGGDAIGGFSTCLPSNCVITIQKANLHVCFPEDDGSSKCVWDLFYTGQECTYDSSKPGLKPPEHEWPEKPVEKPEPDAPDITDLPDTGGGGGEGGKDPIYDPEGEEKPDDPVEKPNPDPKPDPDDPDLDKGDNAIVGELSEANQRLENIDTTLEDLTNTTKLDNDTLLKYQANLLGELKKAHETLKNKPTGGGGGAAAEGNAKLDGIGKTLDGIKCELDEDCEGEGKEKPTVKTDCEKSIFECKGDIIQCALLKIEYEESCPTEQLAELKDNMNKVFATDRTDELVDKDVLDFSKIDSKYLSNGVSFGSATCPASESYTINHFYGSTSVEISYEPACHYAQIAAPIHVILAWIAGLLLIGRTQGAF